MFNVQCQELTPHIEVEKRVAVTIWKLATKVEYRTLSALFSLGPSTVCVIGVETCNATAKHLFLWYVSFPMGERLKDLRPCLRHAGDFPRWAGLLMGHICTYCVSQRECF